jgi:hypothetical protein
MGGKRKDRWEEVLAGMRPTEGQGEGGDGGDGRGGKVRQGEEWNGETG